MGDLRPTLFLAQLSNLLAGNISIVHGVTGASRTFMGEEASGVDALRIAARPASPSGQNDIFLVGGAYNAERPDVLLIYEMGGFLWKKRFRPVFERPAEGGGMILGSGACFLVLESREHAASRGAKPLAAIAGVASDRVTPRARQRRRRPLNAAQAERSARSPTSSSPARPASSRHHRGGAGGARRARARRAIHATGDLVGHTIEARLRPASRSRPALIAAGKAGEALVTSVGHWRGEGARAI